MLMSTMRYPRLVLALWLCFMTCMLCDAPSAAAFCGFFVSGADAKLYNNASQVVLMRKGNHTVMTMSNNYKGPPEDFAMVVPVPVVLKKQQVRTPSAKVFAHVDELTAPRLVEYWEQDPCDNGGGNVSFGALGGRVAQRPKAARSRDDSAADYHVKIEAHCRSQTACRSRPCTSLLLDRQRHQRWIAVPVGRRIAHALDAPRIRRMRREQGRHGDFPVLATVVIEHLEHRSRTAGVAIQAVQAKQRFGIRRAFGLA